MNKKIRFVPITHSNQFRIASTKSGQITNSNTIQTDGRKQREYESGEILYVNFIFIQAVHYEFKINSEARTIDVVCWGRCCFFRSRIRIFRHTDWLDLSQPRLVLLSFGSGRFAVVCNGRWRICGQGAIEAGIPFRECCVANWRLQLIRSVNLFMVVRIVDSVFTVKIIVV